MSSIRMVKVVSISNANLFKGITVFDNQLRVVCEALLHSMFRHEVVVKTSKGNMELTIDNATTPEDIDDFVDRVFGVGE